MSNTKKEGAKVKKERFSKREKERLETEVSTLKKRLKGLKRERKLEKKKNEKSLLRRKRASKERRREGQRRWLQENCSHEKGKRLIGSDTVICARCGAVI